MSTAALFIIDKKLETTQMSLQWGTDEHMVTHPHNRILLGNKEQTTIALKLKCTVLSERNPTPKALQFRLFTLGFHLHDIWKRQNCRDRQQISNSQGLEAKGGNGYRGTGSTAG